MLSSFSYDGMILLLSSFIKMMSIKARIFCGSSSNLFASLMSSSETFVVTISAIHIYNYERKVFSLLEVIELSLSKGCSDASLYLFL